MKLPRINTHNHRFFKIAALFGACLNLLAILVMLSVAYPNYILMQTNIIGVPLCLYVYAYRSMQEEKKQYNAETKLYRPSDHRVWHFLFPRKYRLEVFEPASTDTLLHWDDAKCRANSRISRMALNVVFACRWTYLYVNGFWCCYISGPFWKLLKHLKVG
ncbi:MAG: hypothetical protein AAGA45_03100 [Verrucomicrobiota bacterium]